MNIDWNLVWEIAKPLFAALAGAGVAQLMERNPKVIAWFLHAGSVQITERNSARRINTHVVVIRNVGKKPALNVRVNHIQLPDFSVYPALPYEVLDLPEGGRTILIPRIVPKQQITISYLYYPPLLFNQIHMGIVHDDGFAREVTVVPSPQLSVWQRRAYQAVFILGLAAIAYLLIEGLSQLVRLYPTWV